MNKLGKTLLTIGFWLWLSQNDVTQWVWIRLFYLSSAPITDYYALLLNHNL